MGRGGRWVVAGKAVEGKFTEDSSGASNSFGARLSSKSRLGPELEHGVAGAEIYSSPKNWLDWRCELGTLLMCVGVYLVVK
jgi:hypothetical protein